MHRVVRYLCTSFALAASVAAGQTISDGHCSVKLDPMGLIVAGPRDGLTSTYGPRVVFGEDMVEWFGISFDTPAGRVHAVGEGVCMDYGHRVPIAFVRFEIDADRALAVGRVGQLEIEHSFTFDAATEQLLVGVQLRNTSTTPMNNIMYTREWRRRGLAGGTFPPEWDFDLPPQPGDVWRLAWMPNNILPGQTQGCVLALEPKRGGDVTVQGDDVPLRRWKGGSWPNGIDFGGTFGISFGDFDHDGYIDVFACWSRNLWRNLGGTDWELAANLDPLFPSGSFEYGAAFGDYDNDNLPDIGSEPRGRCMLLMKNLGGATFDDVLRDPGIIDHRPCNAYSETLSIADVDGDGNLDWFLPTYPTWLGSTGNWFLYNKGFDASLGQYTFHEASAEAGLDNPPPPVNRPEGAEFADVDQDGDVDLYSNNTIYRNRSVPGTPLFEAMTESGSGVVFSSILDEGAAFLDYDMDGDLDLCIAFCDATVGVRMFESRGDGTFAVQPKTLFDSPSTGLCLGLSCEDWDNDGDVDVTTSEVFRRNQWQETGHRHYTVATHSIPPGDITDATPAWGDFDKDGDLDTALGNWAEHGRLYENYLYSADTPKDQRRYVRVRVVRDSDQFDDGLETEYGAQVTVLPHQSPVENYPRVRVVSSSAGYLNQNEYVLHFALPPDPDPADPKVDLTFEVAVDFKGTAAQGTVRVDKHVNPALGDVNLARLDDREIVVYRSGRVKIDECDFAPVNPMSPLTTTTGGLVLAGISTPLPAPPAAPGSDWFVGTEISTAGALAPLRLEEIVIDGQLDAAVDCGGTLADTLVWDVTDPAHPALAQGGARDSFTWPRNRRSYLPIDATLAPGRVYRVVARVTSYRITPIAGPVQDGVVTTNGGLFFQDAAPCSGAAVAAASVDPAAVYLALRFRPEPAGAWANLGEALGGTQGEPVLTGSGTLRAGEIATISVSNGAPSASLSLVFGFETDCLPFLGGMIVPSFDIVLPGFTTDASGVFTVGRAWPDGIPGGTTFYLQALIQDAGAPQGFAFSNAIGATAPY